MSKESTITKRAMASALVAGIKKSFAPTDRVVVDGVEYAWSEIIAVFDEHTAAIDEKQARYASYRAAVALERKLARRALHLYHVLHDVLRNRFGPHALPRFGMKPHGKPGPKTVEAKLAGVQKRAKKRAAK